MKDSTLDILTQKRDYYTKLANMCSDILDGRPMSKVCRENHINYSQFRNLIFKNSNTTKSNVTSKDDVIQLSSDIKSPEERILEDVLSPMFLSYKPLSTIEFADDFEDTVSRVIDETFKDSKVKEIIQMYYYEYLNMTQIGSKFGISSARVSQILHGVQGQLRRSDRTVRMVLGDEKYNRYVFKIADADDIGQVLDMIMKTLQFAKDTNEFCNILSEKLRKFKLQHHCLELEDIPDELGIEILDLSPRTYLCLKRNHIDTVRQLASKEDDELMKLRYFGRHTLQDVKKCLANHGFIIK